MWRSLEEPFEAINSPFETPKHRVFFATNTSIKNNQKNILRFFIEQKGPTDYHIESYIISMFLVSKQKLVDFPKKLSSALQIHRSKSMRWKPLPQRQPRTELVTSLFLKFGLSFFERKSNRSDTRGNGTKVMFYYFFHFFSAK